MWYLYELSYSGVPFYVGISHSPEQRYRSHIFDKLSRCYNFIRFNIKHFDKYPELTIIDRRQANADIRDLERSQILMRTQQGISLLNLVWLKMDNVILDKYTVQIPKVIISNIEKQTTLLIN